MNDYKQAAFDRVNNTPELAEHKAIILTAHFFTLDEHYQWVATASVQDLVEWAVEVEQDELQYTALP